MIKRFLDLLFLTRPMLIIPVWTFFFFGFMHGGLTGNFLNYSIQLDIPYINSPVLFVYWIKPVNWLILAAFSFLMSSVYILNQITDIDTDRKNSGFPLLAHGVVSLKSAWIFMIILFCVSLIIAALLHIKLLLVFIISALVGIAYCVRPLRFSGRPFLDFLSNALGYGVLAFGAGFFTAGNFSVKLMIIACIPYVLMMAAGSIASTIPDMPGDSAEGKITTPLKIGIRNSAIISMFFLIAALAVSAWRGDVTGIVVSIFAGLPFINLIFYPTRNNGYPAYQAGGGLLVVISLLLCPPLLVLSIITVISTRVYFRFYYGITYPQTGS